MKKFLPVAFAIIAVGAGVLALLVDNIQKTTLANFRIEKAGIMKEYLEQAAWLRQVEDPKKYSYEFNSLIKWYFNKLAETYKKYEMPADPDARWKDMQAKQAAGTLNEKEQAKMPSYEETFKMSKQVYDAIAAKQIQTVMTQGKDAVRIDFYRVKRGSFQGQNGIQFDFLLNGTFGTQFQGSGIAMNIYCRMPKEDMEAEKKLAKKNAEIDPTLAGAGMDTAGLPEGVYKCAESSSPNGAPNMLINDPSTWIEDFPPQISAGYYVLPPFPREIARTEEKKYPTEMFDVTFKFTATTYGGAKHTIEYVFERLPIDPQWKIAEGEVWEAEKIERSLQ